jgi:hypothetical protein
MVAAKAFYNWAEKFSQVSEDATPGPLVEIATEATVQRVGAMF